MSESSVRDLIARALYEHHGVGFGGGNFHSWNEIVEGGENRPYPEYPHLVDEFRARADAVLAVLADLPDDVIEQAAIELFRDSWGDRPSAVKAGVRWNWLHDEEQQYWRSKVGLVFAAVFGGEQGE
jgi:hypothetical protein